MMVQSLRSFSLNEKICLKYSLLSMIHVLTNCLGFAEGYRKEFSFNYCLFAHIKHQHQQQQVISIPPSHLSTLCHHHVKPRFVSVLTREVFNLANHQHRIFIQKAPEDNVLSIQMGRWDSGDEKLTLNQIKNDVPGIRLYWVQSSPTS